MTEPADVVDAQIAAYEAGDAAKFASYYADDAVCVTLPAEITNAAGREAIERVWGELFARRRLRVQIANRISLGPFVVDHERVTRDTGDVVEAIAVYEVRDGLIRNVWFFAPRA